jgi:hypothetical protein
MSASTNALRELIKGVKRSKNLKTLRRRAFSLIAVLIIAIAGLALVGGILYTFQAFSGASRQATLSSREYNLLQDAVEQGKAFVREQTLALVSSDKPLTWKREGFDNKVYSVGSLLLRDKSGNNVIGHLIKDKQVKENGLDGTLNLYIYVMGYTSDDLVSPDIPLLPPALILGSGSGDDDDDMENGAGGTGFGGSSN